MHHQIPKISSKIGQYEWLYVNAEVPTPFVFKIY